MSETHIPALLSQHAPALLCDLLFALGVRIGEFATVEEVITTARTTIDRLMYNQIVSQTSIDKWGNRGQANQTTEECAELIVALNKYFNRDYNGVDASGVITEIADVEIMCACLRIVFGSDLIEAEKNRKLETLGTLRLGVPAFKEMFDGATFA